MRPRMTDTIACQTLTVPEAAKVLGIGRNQAYEAARRRQLPTIRIGKRLLVPRAALERLLGETK
jgi:excisionase family DNA binding protein